MKYSVIIYICFIWLSVAALHTCLYSNLSNSFDVALSFSTGEILQSVEGLRFLS